MESKNGEELYWITDQRALPSIIIENPIVGDVVAAILRKTTDKDDPKTNEFNKKIGMHGMGGSGKSTLAVMVCYDEKIQKNFTDGIFWVSIGRDKERKDSTAKIFMSQRQIVARLGGNTSDMFDPKTAQETLKKILQYKKCLLIIDDIWTKEDKNMFDVLPKDSESRMLITTRNSELIDDCIKVNINMLDDENSLRALAKFIGKEITNIELPIATSILKQCGGLILALSIVGSMLKQNSDWKSVLKLLEKSSTKELKGPVRRLYGQYSSMFIVLDASYGALTSDDLRSKYLALGIFPPATQIPFNSIRRIWWNDKSKQQTPSSKVLSTLTSNNLIQPSGKKGFYQLHDLLVDFIQDKIAEEKVDLKSLHTHFTNSYRSAYVLFQNVPNDGYILGHLAFHLNRAGREADLAEILRDFIWMSKQIQNFHPSSLIQDFDYLEKESKELKLIQKCLQMSTHALVKDPSPSQLAFLLMGRLQRFRDKYPIFSQLMNQIEKEMNSSNSLWLQPTTNKLLTSPESPLLFTLAGHVAGVDSVLLTPDGTKIISIAGMHDWTTRIWDIKTGKELQKLFTNCGFDSGIALTPDGTKIYAASQSCEIQMWDIESGKQIDKFDENTHTVAITPDGSKLVSGTSIWDLNTRQLLHSLKNDGSVDKLVITPDGTKAIAGSFANTIKIWDINTGAELHTLTGHTHGVHALVVTPDGSKVISGSRNCAIKIWDMNTGECLQTISGYNAYEKAIAVTPDGSKVIYGSEDYSVKIVDINSGKELQSLKGHTYSVSSIAISPNGTSIVTGSYDNTVRVWDINTGKEITTFIGHNQFVQAVKVTADGTKIISTSSDNTVKIWNMNAEKELDPPSGHANYVREVSISPDGSKIVSCDNTTLKIWDLNTLKEIKTITGPSGYDSAIERVVITPDGTKIVTSSRQTVKIWDFKTGNELHTINEQHKFVSDLVTPDGTKIISRTYDAVKINDINTGKVIQTMNGDFSKECVGVLTRDGSKMISGSYYYTLKIWDVNTGNELQKLIGHKDSVNYVTLTPDGKKIISCGSYGDKTVKIWDVESGKEISSVDMDDAIDLVAVTPDGSKIIVGIFDGTSSDNPSPFSLNPNGSKLNVRPFRVIKVIDLESKKLLQSITLTDPYNYVRALAVTPDGSKIITGGEDCAVKIWDLNTGKVLFTVWTDNPMKCICITSLKSIIFADKELHKLTLILPSASPNNSASKVKSLGDVDLKTILKTKDLITLLKDHWYNFSLLFQETEDFADQVQVVKEKEIPNELLNLLWKSRVPLSQFFGKMKTMEKFASLADKLPKKWKVV